MEKQTEEKLSEIIGYLKRFDERITKIENHLNLETVLTAESETEIETLTYGRIEVMEEDEALEYRIGQFLFAKIGILALVIGIIFLLTVSLEDLPGMVPVFAGFASSIIFLLLPRLLKNFLAPFHGYLTGGGTILLFFTVLRLHFFTTEQIVESRFLELILLNVVFLTGLIISIKRGSVYLASLSIFLGYACAVIGESPYYIFVNVILLAVLSSYISTKYNWEILISISIPLGYMVHLIWLINNPFLGYELEIVTEPRTNIVFLFLYMIVFNSVYTVSKRFEGEGFHKITNTVMNALFFYALVLAVSLSGSRNEFFTLTHIAASVLFLIYSAYFWRKEKSKYITFYYAMFGYLALSAAILKEFEIPDAFVWLCWQSIVVITTAVWFRSKFIIVANFFIFLLILFLYLISSADMTALALSFGIASLLSARILNWQKERLELKTENMRNAYLATALLFIPYVLYEIIPEGYVAISWVAVAVTYYILSSVLNNKKYRWMALLTLLITVLYVSLLGLTSSLLIYKIISFLVLGSVLIAISVIYSRSMRKSAEKNK